MLLLMKTLFLYIGIFLLLVGLFFIFRISLRYKNSGNLKEIHVGDNSFLVEVADNALSQMRGLSGRDSLADGQGMLFVFNGKSMPVFWMKDMNFSIDIIWISEGRVVAVSENLPPDGHRGNLPTYSPPSSIDTVLEVTAGVVLKDRIGVGDLVTFR